MLHQFDYLWLENLNFKKRGNFGIEVIIFYFKMPENHKNAKFESFLVGKNQKVPSYDVDDLVDRLNERSKKWIIILQNISWDNDNNNNSIGRSAEVVPRTIILLV